MASAWRAGGRDDRGPRPRPRSGPAWPGCGPRCSSSSGGCLPSPPTPLAQVLPRLGWPARQHARGPAVRAASSGGVHREVDQRLSEVEVAVAVERLVERGELRLATGLHPVEQQATGLAVGLLVQVVDRLAQAAGRARRRPAPRRAGRRASAARRCSGASASSSRSVRNVRRSLRSRRVATRAWCTPSSPASSRTMGSWSRSRRTDGGDGVLERGRIVACLSDGRDVGVARRQRTGSERPGQLGHVVRLARAGRPEHVDHRARSRCPARPSAASTSISRNRRPTSSPSRPTPRRRLSTPSGRSAGSRMATTVRWVWRCGDLDQRRPRSTPRTSGARWSGGGPGGPSTSISNAVERDALAAAPAPSASTGRPAPLPGPVAERDRPCAAAAGRSASRKRASSTCSSGSAGTIQGTAAAGPAPGSRARPRPSPPARGGPRRSRTRCHGRATRRLRWRAISYR